MSNLKVSIASVLIVVGCSVGEPDASPRSQHKPVDRLVGVWQNKVGNRLVYREGMIGENPDGSRFQWRLDGNHFIAQTLSPEGKPTGEPFRAPISFTKDGKEYTMTIEGGKRDITYYRVGSDRQIDQQRTPEGRAYVSGPKAAGRRAAPSGDEFADTPVYDDPLVPVAGTHSIVVGPNIQVSQDREDVSHWEVILAADPADPRRLLAGSMCNPPPIDYGTPKIFSYVTTDGGKTWRPSLERIGSKTEVFADPDASYGPDGTLYFANLAGPELGSPQGSVEVSCSMDGGESWGQPTRIAGWRDRPFLAVDRTNGEHQGRVYCITADGVFTSADAGKTFDPAVPLVRRSSYIPTGTGNVVVLSDGRVVALYHGFRAEAGRDAVSTSTPPAYLAVRVSRDGGATFGEESVIAEGQISALPPSVAAGPSGCPYADRLYVVWKTDAGSRVMCSRSSDGGATWEKPRILSEQADREPDAGAGKIAHLAYLPAIAANKDGVIGVSWYDTRGLPVKQAGYNIRFRASADGGETWLPSVPVSSVSTLWTASVKQRYPKPEEEAGYWRGGPGHTAGLAADAEGVFHPLWIDGRTGIRQVFTATVRVSP